MIEKKFRSKKGISKKKKERERKIDGNKNKKVTTYAHQVE
jgi:hypothetical protein